MAATKQLIATVTVGAGGASGIDFTSIPQGFTDLCIVVSLRTGYSQFYQYVPIYFNNIGTGYSGKNLMMLPSVTTNSSSWNETSTTAATATANVFSNGTIYIPNYASSSNKAYSFDAVTENNSTNSTGAIFAGLWANTSAINLVALSAAGQTFQQYSTASLYGITNGSGGATVS